jgi:hypothetical protein
MSEDHRLRKPVDQARLNRSSKDEAREGDRKLSDAERIESFRLAHYQSALPDLPKLDGYHVCWLTTTNPRDPIAKRISWGYEPITADMIPGWDYGSVKTGEWAGMIGVNEMIAFRIPSHLYERYMEEAHNKRPQQQEQIIADAAERLKELAKRNGSSVAEGDGIAALRANAPRARFES